MPHLIPPKMVVVVFLCHTTKQVIGFMPILPEILLQQAKEQAINYTIQGVVFATMHVANQGIFFGPDAKSPLISESVKSLANCNSPEEFLSRVELASALSIVAY